MAAPCKLAGGLIRLVLSIRSASALAVLGHGQQNHGWLERLEGVPLIRHGQELAGSGRLAGGICAVAMIALCLDATDQARAATFRVVSYRRGLDKEAAMRHASMSDPLVDDLACAVDSVPTDQAEADGTTTWSSTTCVTVEVTAGGHTGRGYT